MAGLVQGADEILHHVLLLVDIFPAQLGSGGDLCNGNPDDGPTAQKEFFTIFQRRGCFVIYNQPKG